MQAQSPQYSQVPPSANFPSQLTLDGIRQLFNSSSTSNNEYILQIIKIIEDYSQNKMYFFWDFFRCYLSDGFCYVTCLLTGQARLKNIKGELDVFDVVRIRKEDVIVLGLDRNPSLQLCNFTILGMRLLCSIGQPVAYMTYYHNSYLNPKGSTKISDGQRIQNTLTISELVGNYPHVPTKWILKAKVIRKPDNISMERPFMIVKLMDGKDGVIQGVFFGQVAVDAYRKLVCNREYLFNNGQVKTKKSSSTEFEIKFTQQSQIIPIQTLKSTHTTTQPQSQPQPSSSPYPYSQSQSQPQQITINDITNNLSGNLHQHQLVTVAGKVLRLRSLSKGRCMDVVDRNSDVIQIVLWEEIKDEVKEGVTYIFENLRTKSYNSNISLQSVRSKTIIKKAPFQIQRQPPTTPFHNPTPTNTPTTKQLRNQSNLYSVTAITQLQIKQKQYHDIYGFLIINTTYMDTKNFFKLDCSQCKTHPPQISINPFVCMKCSDGVPSVRWNLRCRLVDQTQDVKCVMNQELCQRLFRMGSMEGLRKLGEDKDYVRRKVEEVSHIQGIFKVKINPYKDSVYYNIVDMYRNDSSAILNKTIKDLKTVMKKLITN